MFGVITTLALLTAAPLPNPRDYQKLADDTKWEWSSERANLIWYLAIYQGDYQVDIVKKPNTFGKLFIRFSKDGDNPILTIEGHYATAFLYYQNILYYTVYHPSSSGCTLVAYDLAKKKELWKTNLKGIGPIEHTKYANHVALDFAGQTIKVLGNESAGDYVEFVEIHTGKTVGHKVFRKGFGR